MKESRKIVAVGPSRRRVGTTLRGMGLGDRYLVLEADDGGDSFPRGIDAELVALSRETYEALLDAAEAAEDRAARAAHAATRGEERIPVAVVERLMIAGENPIKVWREHRGLTVARLAAAAGVGKSYISEIEHDTKPGSLKVRRRIAAALRVDLDDLERPAA